MTFNNEYEVETVECEIDDWYVITKVTLEYIENKNPKEHQDDRNEHYKYDKKFIFFFKYFLNILFIFVFAYCVEQLFN